MKTSTVKNGKIFTDNVCYDHVFVPHCPFENSEIIKRLQMLDHTQSPLLHADKTVLCRCRDTENESFYSVMNPSAERITASLVFFEAKPVCRMNLNTGRDELKQLMLFGKTVKPNYALL